MSATSMFTGTLTSLKSLIFSLRSLGPSDFLPCSPTCPRVRFARRGVEPATILVHGEPFKMKLRDQIRASISVKILNRLNGIG